MSNLTPDELARLRLKAKHGTLTPEEQRAYNDYVTEQLSAVPSPPSGAVPPKKDTISVRTANLSALGSCPLSACTHV